MNNGRRQHSGGGTSRMMREYHVRICERLGVKFPGPTRHERTSPILRPIKFCSELLEHRFGRHQIQMAPACILDCASGLRNIAAGPRC